MSAHLRFTPNPRSERGQALVEFVFVLPLLVLVLFATIELALLLNQWNNLTQVAGSVARKAAVNHDSAFNPVAYGTAQAERVNTNNGLTISVCTPDGPDIGGRVQVTTRARPTLLLRLPGLTGLVLPAGKATMRLESKATFPTTGSC
jgi:Flp pilus assembly protein TadG